MVFYVPETPLDATSSRCRSTSHTYQTTAEFAALAQARGDHGDVVALLSCTGLRFGELVDLRVEVVDLAWTPSHRSAAS